jgi:hypothetical protein
MSDEDTGEEIPCPYCGQVADCDHLLAMIDQSFNECCGGYAFDRYEEFQTVIQTAFGRLLRLGKHKECPWSEETLCDLWQSAREAYATGDEDEDVSLDEYLLTGLIIEVLADAGGVRYSGSIHDPGPPGFSSTLTVFHAKNPQSVFDIALANLQLRLQIPG